MKLQKNTIKHIRRMPQKSRIAWLHFENEGRQLQSIVQKHTQLEIQLNEIRKQFIPIFQIQYLKI